MSEKETNKPSKNLLVKLLELIIKGVMGFFMLFYLLWKNTAEPLHKEVYDNSWTLKTIGGALALGSGMITVFFLLPVLGPWALAASVVAAVLTYSHIFPLLYIVGLRPIYRLLCRFKDAIRTALRKLCSYLWRFVRFVWRNLVKFVQWLDKVISAVWTWLSGYLGRFVRFVWRNFVKFVQWLDKVISAVWTWLSDKVMSFFSFVWPIVTRFFSWFSKVISRTWQWLKNTTLRVWSTVASWVSKTYNFVATAISSTWRTITTLALASWNWLVSVISPLLTAIGNTMIRLAARRKRMAQQLSLWADSVWNDILAMANAISNWAAEIWTALTRLYERLSYSKRH